MVLFDAIDVITTSGVGTLAVIAHLSFAAHQAPAFERAERSVEANGHEGVAPSVFDIVKKFALRVADATADSF
jgi:hypothetical protein